MTALGDALEPVRAALLREARAAASATAERAEAQAARVLEEARGEAAAILAQARAEGEQEAAIVRARAAARAHREARETVLRAQQDAYARLHREARAGVRALRGDPAYPAMVERLTARATSRLGTDAVVHEHPDGGVLAEAPGRRLDLSLPALADRAVDDLGAEVAALWAADA